MVRNMSFEPNNDEREDSIRDLLNMILIELRLLNERIEEEFKTTINRKDIENDHLWRK